LDSDSDRHRDILGHANSPRRILAICALATAYGDGGNPFASFETRSAKLPATHFGIVAVPFTFERDDSQSIAALTSRSGSALATQQTMALTTAVFGQSTDIQLNVIDNAKGSRACGTPRVRVELSMQPVTVFDACELGDASPEQ